MEKPAQELLDLPVEIMSQVLATNPISSIKFMRIKYAIYARWRIFRNVHESLKATKWKEWMGHVRSQGRCDVCWAVVTAELVSALLFIKGINKEYIEYSAQDLIDFVAPDKARNCKVTGHYCYTSSINRGLLYVLQEGLQRDMDRPYKRCRHASQIPARTLSGLAHIDGVEKLTFDEGLEKLKTQPIGASLHIFMPDYMLTGKGIYRGPMLENSTFRGMHAVSIIGVDEEDGEKYFLVKSTHGNIVGDEGYLKVSMETMLVQIAKDDMVPAPGMVRDDKFVRPKPLIYNFCCPTLKEGSPMKCI